MKIFKRVLIIIVALVIMGSGGFVGAKLYSKYSEGTERADRSEYYKLTSDVGAIMFDGTILEEKCRILNGVCYLDLNTIQKYLHNRFYYSELDREIRYTDADTIAAAYLDSESYSYLTLRSAADAAADYIIAIEIDGMCYIALDFVEKFVPVTHQIFAEPDRVVMESMELCKEVAAVRRDTAVRWRAGVKSEILTDVPKGQQVMIIDDSEVEGWVKVATQDGFVGYVKDGVLGTRAMVTGTSTLEYQEPEYTSIQMEEGIRLGFHAVYNQTANGNLNSVLETAYNINVISPTWVSLSDNEGGFTHISSEAYVKTAHDRGIQVWALVEDITNDVDTYEILGRHASRSRLIGGLMDLAETYDYDGLNIDFEGIRSRDGAHFVQFLRELSIECRDAGIVLSVDNYPPNSGNAYYDYKEQGIIADYVVLMGYDEHWGGSGDPGSTSSQPFLETSLDNLVKQVPASKIINALPFYTRLWRVEGSSVTDKAIYMKSIGNAVSEYGMVIGYDEEAEQKYAEAVSSGGVTHKMWIEDYASIENKLIAVTERDLAGVAAWRLGYEEQEIWELIGNYIK